MSFHGAALPPISLTPGTDAYDGSKATGPSVAMPSELMADDAAAPTRGAGSPEEEPELHGRLRGRAHRGGP